MKKKVGFTEKRIEKLKNTYYSTGITKPIPDVHKKLYPGKWNQKNI